jgi:hypothetical protein
MLFSRPILFTHVHLICIMKSIKHIVPEKVNTFVHLMDKVSKNLCLVTFNRLHLPSIMKTTGIKTLFTAVLFIFATSSFVGCKYEDGPTMSLKSKKMRLSNIWQFEKVTLDGVDQTNDYFGSDFKVAFEIYKHGNYSWSLRDLDGNLLNREASNNRHQQVSQALSANKPLFFSLIGTAGKWTFHDKFEKVLMYRELSQEPTNEIVPELDIKELRTDRVQLSYIYEGGPLDGRELLIILEPLERN